MAKTIAGPRSLLCPSPVLALWAVLWGPVGQPTPPEISHPVREAITLCTGETRDPLVPFSLPAGYVKTCKQDPASSHILKTYSELVFTVLRKGCDADQERAPPLEEPPCLHRGSSVPDHKLLKRSPLGSNCESLARGCLRASGLKQWSSLCKHTAPTII